MISNYYVYAYLHPDTKEFKYVGKGKGSRYKEHIGLVEKGKKTSNKRFTKWMFDLVEVGKTPIIVKMFTDKTPGEALLLEHNIIKKYGRVGYDKGGILLNHTIGFEHFNIDKNNKNEIILYLEKIDSGCHFNKKVVPIYIQEYILFEYKNGTPQNKLREQIKELFEYKISTGTIKNVLESKNIYIRTKSDTRKGELNPAYGRRGLKTKGFSGKHHSEESLEKMIKTKREKFNARHQ